MKSTIALAIILFGAGSCSGHIQRETIVSRCMQVPRDDLEDCLVTLINEIQPRFAEGLPELGLEPMATMPLGIFRISEYINENNYLEGTFSKTAVKGFQDMILTSLKVDYDRHEAKLTAMFPELFASGLYTLNASFAILPIVGEGSFWMRLEKILVDFVMTFDFPLSNDGKRHVRPVDMVLDFEYEDIVIRLNNLGDGNPVLKAAMEAVVQDNARELMNVVKPQMIQQLIEVIRDRTNKVSDTITLEEIAGNEFAKKSFQIEE